MVWGLGEDYLEHLSDLWPVLSCQRLGENPQKQTPLMVDSSRSGCGSSPVRAVPA